MADVDATTDTQEPEEGQSKALLPSKVLEVKFNTEPLIIALIDDVPYVAVKPFCDYLELTWGSQYNRIMRDPVLAEVVRVMAMEGADGRRREMVSLPLEMLPGWLFTISAQRTKPELQPKLTLYRAKCFRVLWEAYQRELLPRASTPAISPTNQVLAIVRDNALAIAQLAENQMALEERVTTVNARLDKAAAVVGDMQRRLSTVEHQLQPAAYITDAQSAEISQGIKALAELLTRKEGATTKDTGKRANNYQTVFGELYRRFGVSSYKLLRQADYEPVLQFLEEWRQAVVGEEQEVGEG